MHIYGWHLFLWLKVWGRRNLVYLRNEIKSPKGWRVQIWSEVNMWSKIISQPKHCHVPTPHTGNGEGMARLSLLSNGRSSPMNMIIKMHWIKNIHRCIIHEINNEIKHIHSSIQHIHKINTFVEIKYTKSTYLEKNIPPQLAMSLQRSTQP